MRLSTYGAPGAERAAFHWGEHLLDVARASELFDATSPLPADPLALVPPEMMARLEELERKLLDRTRDDGVGALPTGISIGRDQVRLGPPIPRPPKIICLGLNYRDHASEQNAKLPERPLLFAKARTAVVGPSDQIIIDSSMKRVDYELELGVVIGAGGRRIAAADALNAVAGYLVFLDISDREAQFSDRQWYRGKSRDTFAPTGPWMASGNSVGDPGELAMKLELNGEVRQESTTSQMIFRVPEVIEFISRTITLEPGDILATGTPSGVGVFRDPPIFLRPGDRIRAEIENLGVLETTVRAEDHLPVTNPAVPADRDPRS